MLHFEIEFATLFILAKLDKQLRRGDKGELMQDNKNMISTNKSSGLMYWWTVACLMLITGAVNLQVPLYQHYAEINHANNAISALAFAAYVAGLVPVLLGFAGASDRFGRKPVLYVALLSSFSATLIMTYFPNIHSLFIARVLQGVGVGLAMGTVAAYLSEQRPFSEKIVAGHVTLASSLGFGGGALATTGSLMLLNTGVPMSYWVALGALSIAIAGLLFTPVFKKNPSIPMMRFPKFLKGSASAYLGICAAWSVSGLVIALLPAQLAKHDLATWAGPALFLVNIIGIMFQPMARCLSTKTNLAIGSVLIPLGYITLVYGSVLGDVTLLLLGSAIAGSACYGFTYLGGLSVVVEKAGQDKARAVSGYFLSAYCGFALPSILMGFLADSFGVTEALEAFGVAIVMVHFWLLCMIYPPRMTFLALYNVIRQSK